MSLTSNDYLKLQQIMDESPDNQKVIQKLLDSHQYTISKISHEIRNPLALVYSTLQMIESQHPETTSFKYWSQMRGDVEFMIQLLQELSSYNNGERLHKTVFSAHSFLSNISLSFASSFVETDVSFSSKIPDSLPDICADKLKLREAILNLLRNAKEAIYQKGYITLHAFSDEQHLIIQIADTGSGIPPEHLETIFDTFVTYKTEGTGLGLAITKRIIQAHGGEILVESEVDEGSCFTIKLPLQ